MCVSCPAGVVSLFKYASFLLLRMNFVLPNRNMSHFTACNLTQMKFVHPALVVLLLEDQQGFELTPSMLV